MRALTISMHAIPKCIFRLLLGTIKNLWCCVFLLSCQEGTIMPLQARRHSFHCFAVYILVCEVTRSEWRVKPLDSFCKYETTRYCQWETTALGGVSTFVSGKPLDFSFEWFCCLRSLNVVHLKPLTLFNERPLFAMIFQYLQVWKPQAFCNHKKGPLFETVFKHLISMKPLDILSKSPMFKIRSNYFLRTKPLDIFKESLSCIFKEVFKYLIISTMVCGIFFFNSGKCGTSGLRKDYCSRCF